MQEPKARFEFNLLPKIFPAQHYKCASWKELIDRMRTNPYLHLPGIGAEILKQNAMITRRQFKHVPRPVDINSLDPHNNIGHLWFVFAYLLNPNELAYRDEEFRRRLSNKELIMCNILDSDNIDHLARDQCRSDGLQNILNKFIIPCLSNLIISYVDQTRYYILIVNALFQLYIYIQSTGLLNGECDQGLFAAHSFGFHPATMLTYITQISGFRSNSLPYVVELEKLLRRLMDNYLGNKLSPCVANYIAWDIEPDPYNKFATGDKEDNILESNKRKLRASKNNGIMIRQV